MSTSAPFDGAWSVNQTIATFPQTVAVFNQFGIDACCGGAASVVDAAARDAADPEQMLAALQHLIDAHSGDRSAGGRRQ